MSEYRRARALARMLHRGQKDKAGRPYFSHVHRVADRMETYGEATVAFLHDVVEDTQCELNDLRVLGFSWDVVAAVDALTRREGETYAAFVERCAQHPVARRVKVADVLDHLEHTPEALSPSMRQRYTKALAKLREVRP